MHYSDGDGIWHGFSPPKEDIHLDLNYFQRTMEACFGQHDNYWSSSSLCINDLQILVAYNSCLIDMLAWCFFSSFFFLFNFKVYTRSDLFPISSVLSRLMPPQIFFPFNFFFPLIHFYFCSPALNFTIFFISILSQHTQISFFLHLYIIPQSNSNQILSILLSISTIQPRIFTNINHPFFSYSIEIEILTI